MSEEKIHFIANDAIMDRSIVPEVIYDENKKLIDLYYAAWQSAYGHIFTCHGAPVETYMNEGIRSNHIWIWDTCFMVLFCRYAAKHFPGIQSLDNFYRVMHNNESMVLKVHHPDNPPLFAWTEYEYLLHSGDKDRIRHILIEKRYLQRHYQWLNELKANVKLDYAFMLTGAEFIPGKGFMWSGNPSGMDNTPRGDDDYESIYWFDLSAQQGLSALYISRLAESIGEEALAKEWKQEYLKQKEFVNKRFWSEEDQMYFDFFRDESGFCKVLTPAAAWPLLAEMSDKKQAAALAFAYDDPDRLGFGPFATVTPESKYFDPTGRYWRGGIWLPTAYMSIKALERNGFQSLADSLSEQLVDKLLRTYENFEPHTLWECYSPTEDMPATKKIEGLVRPDFCGWTALGPISLFIENILGVREVNSLKNTITYEPRSKQRSGIRNLNMADNVISLLTLPEEKIISVEAKMPFTLILPGRSEVCPAGKSVIQL